MVCFPFVGDSVGGSHISALVLIRHLDRDAFRPLVVVHEEGPLTALLREAELGYELLPLPRALGRGASPWGHGMALLRSLPPLWRFLRREAVAIVHTNDARMHLTWALPARLAGCAGVWHQRNVVSRSRLSALLIRLAKTVIANSHFVAGQMSHNVKTRTVVIDNPFECPSDIDRAAYRRRLLEEIAAPEGAIVVGLFGNLIGWKRPLLFAEVAARVTEAFEGPVVFAVFGEDREGFEAAMQERAGDRLHFMGFRHPVWPWMAACDLVLAPAVDEPFGRSLVEAMLVGTPVVAADSGGHREIIADGQTGILVAPDDAEAMARAVVALLQDAARRAGIAATAKDAAQPRYGAQTHAQAVGRVYRNILGQA